MGMTYSEWIKTVEDSRAVGKESFEALFDKRDSGQGNEAMEDFFRAYVSATMKTKEEGEDRFPCLAEIKKKLKGSSAVYDLRKRLKGETEFFEEEKEEGPPGRVFLIPKAKEFTDLSGKYTPLKFDFEKGILIFPEYIEEGVKAEKLTPGKGPWKLIAAALILFLAVVGGIYYNTNTDSSVITQNIYLSKDVQGDFLVLEISNPSGEFIESTVSIPKGVMGKDVTLEGGGTVSVSGTGVKVSARKNSHAKIYLKEIKSSMPIKVTSKVQEGYKAVPKVRGIKCATTQEDNIANFEFNLASENVLIEIEVQK